MALRKNLQARWGMFVLTFIASLRTKSLNKKKKQIFPLRTEVARKITKSQKQGAKVYKIRNHKIRNAGTLLTGKTRQMGNKGK